MKRSAATLALLTSGALLLSQQPPPRLEATVNAQAAARPFPHFWERMFGSGRAILSLRDSYRRDLRAVRDITGFSYVRFHAIFHDETGLYQKDGEEHPVYNFSYIDQIYDGLLENGVRPFVELSFMPRALSATQNLHAFWYKPLPNPPKSYDEWGDLVYNFTRHLVERYGVDEVANWYFEVWNEPNIDFWAGEPRQSTYFELYDAAAAAVKRASPRLRIGGPATAQAAWVDAMIAHADKAHVPLDFVSTHVYGNDSAEDVFGTHEKIPRSDMVARAVRKVHDQVSQSAHPDLPIIWSEYNASYKNEVDVTDAPFLGPWLANTIRLCDGLQTMMSYWTFSDVFEEQGVVKTPFYGGYGLIAADGIPKAAFNDFAMLHQLGEERLPLDVPWALATRRRDGSLAIAAWNYAPPEEAGQPMDAHLTIQGAGAFAHVRIQVVDRDHGSSLTAWEAMGRPSFPTREQIQHLRDAATIPPPRELQTLSRGSIDLHLQPHSLALIEVLH
jgi:xylan 1,4-beta-xylosidase